MAALEKIGNKMPLSKRAYYEIKEAIITNKIKQGQLLTEEQLASELGISRTPVRSAIKMLEYEKLVNINASKNIVVSSVTEKDIVDATLARTIVEQEAVSILAEIITEEQINILKEIDKSQQRAHDEGDFQEFIKYDYKFHVNIGDFSDNIWFSDIIKNVCDLQRRLLILTGRLEKDWDYVASEHEQIIESLERHDSEAARNAMKEHLSNVKQRLLENMED